MSSWGVIYLLTFNALPNLRVDTCRLLSVPKLIQKFWKLYKYLLSAHSTLYLGDIKRAAKFFSHKVKHYGKPICSVAIVKTGCLPKTTKLKTILRKVYVTTLAHQLQGRQVKHIIH